MRATTVNGGLRIAFRGALKKSELETVNGSVEVAFDKASSVRYDLQTVNGRIEGDFELAVEGKHGPKEARGSYNGGSESLHCETVNGSSAAAATSPAPSTAPASPKARAGLAGASIAALLAAWACMSSARTAGALSPPYRWTTRRFCSRMRG